MTPRKYLSWSQLYTFEESSELYRRKYLLGEELIETPAMAFGRRVHKMLELDVDTDDLTLQHVKNFIPSYPKREHTFKSFARVGRAVVPLLCVFDCYDPRKKRIADIKTGKKWTQKMADESGQLTFYAFAYWQNYSVIPKELAIIWIETEDGEDDIQATGNVQTFLTTRTPFHMIQMQQRIEKAWKGIKELSAKEFRSIL